MNYKIEELFLDTKGDRGKAQASSAPTKMETTTEQTMQPTIPSPTHQPATRRCHHHRSELAVETTQNERFESSFQACRRIKRLPNVAVE